MSDLTELASVTEERTQMLDVMKKRLTLTHSITLHRDSTSAADVKAMIAQLEAAGMPPEATLKVDGTNEHTRMWAQWAEAVS